MMIKNRDDYKYYLKCDSIARWSHKPSFIEKIKFFDLWKFHVLLRKQEYNLNCRKGFIRVFLDIYFKWRKLKLTEKLGWDIPPNVFGPGLVIVHIGPVIVNGAVRIGENCRIHAMVNIGANNGEKNALTAGDNLYIGPGAKIFGNIKLGDNVSIGANAVVNKSFEENDIVLAGVPAKIVRHK